VRIFIAGLATETNTFATFPTGRRAFEESGISRDTSRTTDSVFSPSQAAIRELAELAGDEIIESITAFAQPAGRTVQHVYERLRDEILADLRAAHAQSPVDVVLLSLHGAMVAEQTDDCEGDILAHVREVAPDAVVGIVLDLHCHLTEKMVTLADMVIAVKEYPHIDFRERSIELFHLCRRTALGEIHPVAALVDTRMIGMYPTFSEPMKGVVAGLREVETQPRMLSATIAHGFPWADVADVGTRVLVYSDGDAGAAKAAAESIAAQLYALREALLPKYPDIETSLTRAATLSGRIVLGDYSDNPGGGGAGDSTFFLEALIARNERDVVVGCLWDPIVASVCADAGEGATVHVRLGGKMGPLSGKPLDLAVRVVAVKPNHSEGVFGGRQPLGLCVWLHVLASDGSDAAIDVIVSSIRAQVYEPDAFTGLGLSLEDTRLIIVKSSTHYEAGFRGLADHLWHVRTPGAMTLDLAALPYTKRDGNYFPRLADPWATHGVPSARMFVRRR
jgi:microcystin degradation protein MlrC